jgi:AraC-like DNA-binding protein
MVDPISGKIPDDLPVILSIYGAAIVERAVQRGANIDQVLAGTFLRRDALFDPETYLPTACVYAAIENASRLTNSPWLGAEIAEEFHHPSAALRVKPGFIPKSVSDYIVNYLIEAGKVQSAVQHRLIVDPVRAAIIGERAFSTVPSSAQGDAWDIAAWVTILRALLGQSWDPASVQAWTTDPRAIPPSILPENVVHRGKANGTRIEFPNAWLTIALKPGIFSVSNSEPEISISRRTIRDVFATLDLSQVQSMEQLAGFLGYSVRTFKRRLDDCGVKYSALLEELRQSQAYGLLSETNTPINEISRQLGYNNASSFNRAFLNWKNMSPGNFRAEKQKP